MENLMKYFVLHLELFPHCVKISKQERAKIETEPFLLQNETFSKLQKLNLSLAFDFLEISVFYPPELAPLRLSYVPGLGTLP
jgi:hypothetical protein